ncbi:MAG: fumarylacetoacetate hydrolase family protein [Alphaproteobacteria bacterium]|nr:fumarylacetoacetate hydrolase family protein [Alphaproteobacteria bacterium]
MKLGTFEYRGRTAVGAVKGEGIVDLSAEDPAIPNEMTRLIAAGRPLLERIRTVLETATAVPLADVSLRAPILRPPKILAIGLNYADHIEESGMQRPEHQLWFNKQSTCVIGSGEPIAKPAVSDYLDYEAEVCVVIGKRCRHVPRERAGEVIFGFCVGNDVSVRDWQLRTPTMTIGKSFDTHGPIGPFIVTSDEIADPHALDIRCWVNGELRQNSNTRHLVFNCFDQIAHLTTAFTLEPGDILFTGTPAGVGGAFKPPRFLRPGDSIRIEVEGLGVLENTVLAEVPQPVIG